MSIVIDKVEYDPYFILGVVEDDSEKVVMSKYKKKSKLLHPDKMTSLDKKDSVKVAKRYKQFLVLNGCYEYIMNTKNNHKMRNTEDVEINSNHDIDRGIDSDTFNAKFERLRTGTPSDVGYNYERMESLNGDNFNDIQKQYEREKFNTTKIFSNKSYNRDEFNKAFEYNNSLQEKHENQVIHKTTDGFSGYNSGALGDNCASVSSFNGILITGDSNFNGNYFSDYRQSLSTSKNPKNAHVPDDFRYKSSDKVLSQSEFDNQLRLRQSQSISFNKDSKATQERELSQAKRANIEMEVEKNKEFILKYKHMYDEKTIQQCLDGNLIKSPDLVLE